MYLNKKKNQPLAESGIEKFVLEIAVEVQRGDLKQAHWFGYLVDPARGPGL